MLKRIFTNRVFLNTIILTLFMYSVELLVRIFTGAPFNDFSIVRILISTTIICLFISWIGHFLPRLGQRILNIIFILFINIYEFAEFGLQSYIGFFMGIGNANQGTKVVGEFLKDYMSSFKLVHWTILIPMVVFILYYVIFDRMIMKKKKRNSKMTMLQKVYIEVVTVIFLCCLCGFYYFTIRSNTFKNALQTESNYSLWLYPENSNLTVNNFGVAMYGFCDIKSTIMGIDAEYILKLEAKEQEKNKDKNKDKTPIDLERKIDDRAWDELIKNTTNENYKTLNYYFKNRDITQKNGKTGIFKDKNLIIIMLESTNEIFINNKEYFPTMYKMYHEGISFKNNYSPRNNCSTGNNEFTSLSSLFTINNTCTANAYVNNKYFEASFNVFNRAGYYTSAYHDYTQKFYRRATSLPNMGAQKYYGVEALGMPYQTEYTEADDGDMFKSAKQYYMNQDKFMSYFATVTPHQSYISSQVCSDRYYKKYRDLGYSTNLSRYLSKLQVTDEALAELLKELEDSGKLEDTVIAIFCDHYPYGLSDSQINEFFNKNEVGYTMSRNTTSNKNVDKTPMLIYNAGMEPIVYEQYSTIIDLLPTLLNMFDLGYDPRLYLGTDAFSESHQSRAVFADGSWESERGYYHAPNSKMNYHEGATQYTNEELVAINKEISTRQKMSALAIRNNYFKYLGEGLEKYKIVEPDPSEEEQTEVEN